MRRLFVCLFLGLSSTMPSSGLHAESEPLDEELAMQPPYVFSGRLFAARSSTASRRSGSGVAVGPGLVLSAAHVFWTEAWEDNALPDSASPWLDYRKWVPASSSSMSESFENVVSLVSLAGYDDVLHEYDDKRQDSVSSFEAFNRDSFLLTFSDNLPTPYGGQQLHPRASESGFLGDRNFYEVVGYPSAKYSGSDSRKWLMHKTTETDSIVVSKIPSSVYDRGYSFENHLFSGGEPIDSYAGNSGGPVIARSGDTEEWLMAGVYIGANALFRGIDEEMAKMINTASNGQFAETDSRIQFTQSEVALEEGGDPVVIQVQRLGDATEAASGSIQVIQAGAQEDSDFETSFDLSWGAGESGDLEVTLTPLEDELREKKENFIISLQGSDGLALGYPNVISVTVVDNDLNGPLDAWVSVDEVGAFSYSEVVFEQNKFVSVGLNNIVRWSPDFQDVEVKEYPGLNRLFQLTYANGLFLACGDGPQIVISEDAENWELINIPTIASMFSINYGHGWYVAVGGVDASNPLFSEAEIWVSRDARSWFKTYDERHEIFDDVEFGNGRFVCRAERDIYISTDALNWEKAETIGLGGTPNDIEFGAGLFVNAGRLGGIFTTPDGIIWTQVRQEDDEPWFGVGYHNGYFVSTGIAGKVATSSDGGLTWIDRFPETEENLWHGVAAAGKMTVIGDNAILITTDLPEFFDFVLQPVSQVVMEGSSFALSAEFVSSSNEVYSLQWQKNGVDISGETSSTLVFDSVNFDDRGAYTLVVSGNYSQMESEPAAISVETPLLAPQNLAAFTATSRGMKIDWEDFSSGEDGFLIERRYQGGDWIQIVEVGANQDSYYDTNLTPGTQYEYRVSALMDETAETSTIVSAGTQSATDLINLSTRGLVGDADDVMIGGFVIPDGPNMTLYIRGIGPSLQSREIPKTISDPHLRLVEIGVSNPIEVVNSDWPNSLGALAIIETGLPPEDNREAAILVTLPPGAYTAVLSNEEDESMAVGLIEIFDLTNCDSCRLVNLSTRGPVGQGSELMIGGLVVEGDSQKKVLVRVIGPTLPVDGATLQDPYLRMVPETGPEITLDDWWQSDNSTLISQFDLIPNDDREVAEVFEVQQGSYTFLVTGADGGIGNVLLEIFEVE